MYLLKLVIVVILGTVWLRFMHTLYFGNMPIGALPIGAIIGLIGIRLLEKDATDRKIWYAVLILVTVISYFFPTSISI